MLPPPVSLPLCWACLGSECGRNTDDGVKGSPWDPEGGASRLATGICVRSSARPGDTMGRSRWSRGAGGDPHCAGQRCTYRLQKPAAGVSPRSCPRHRSLPSPPRGHRRPAATAMAQGGHFSVVGSVWGMCRGGFGEGPVVPSRHVTKDRLTQASRQPEF